MKFDREKNIEQRREFVRFQARWVKSVPNEVWSRQQADLIDSFLENAMNLDLTPEQYLGILRERGSHRRQPRGDKAGGTR